MKFHQYSWTRRSLFRGLKWEIKLGAAALTDGKLDNCDGGGRKCESLQANDLYAIIRRFRWRGGRVRLCNAVCLEKASIHCQKSRFTIRLLTESSWAPAALNKVCVCVHVYVEWGGGHVPVYKLRLNCQRTKAVARANSWTLRQSRCDWTTCQTLLRVYHGTFQSQSLWWIEP